MCPARNWLFLLKAHFNGDFVLTSYIAYVPYLQYIWYISCIMLYYYIISHNVACAWYKIKCISHVRAAAPRRYFDRVGGVFCARAGENVFGTGEPSNRRLGNVPPGRRGQVDMQRGRSVVHAHLCLRCCSAHTCAPLGANTFLSTASPRHPLPPNFR